MSGERLQRPNQAERLEEEGQLEEPAQQHDLFASLEQYSDEREKLNWNGTFKEYFYEKLIENPNVARSSHATVYNAFMAQPDYFTTSNNALYGAQAELDQLKGFLRSGYEGLPLGKRILLLIGGPGSGKSTAARGLKELMEAYSETDEGAMYGIAGCELHEEPLHLIPKKKRSEVEKELGIRIEGELCENCKLKYGQKDNISQIGDVPVERIFLSEQNNTGISSFEPSDPKSMDISDLIGEVDFSKIGEIGATSDARAYRFNGAFHKANRGMLELVEFWKHDEKFHYPFLSVAEERAVKAKTFPYTTLDEVLVAHSNLSEYYRCMKDDRNEAIRDRTVIIWWKYPLKVSDERKVYEKLISEGELVRRKDVHVNPKALDVAANFSVLTRIRDTKNMQYTKLQKLKLYDGQDVDGLSARDLKALREEDRDEGLTGVSPRYVIDSLSSELVEDGKKCLTPAGVLRALEANINRHAHTREMDQKQKEALHADFATAKSIYKEIALSEIKRAFIGAREDEVAAIADKYLEHVGAYCAHQKLEDEFSEEGKDPDEEFMRSIESKLSITESGKKEHRSEMAARIMNSALKHQEFSYKSLPKLQEAIEDRLFASMKDAVRMVTSARVPNEKQKQKMADVRTTLVEEQGYCDDCAGELIRYASQLLNESND